MGGICSVTEVRTAIIPKFQPSMNEGYDKCYTTSVAGRVLSASRLLHSYRILHGVWIYIISIDKIICGIPTLCENIAVFTSLEHKNFHIEYIGEV